MPLTLAHVPEEILERILALILVQSPESSHRPSWHPYTTPSTAAGHANIISPLLVCRAWLRIATPIHYRHPVLRTPRHAELLLRALRHTPDLALCVRSLHLHATSPALRDIVSRCAYLHTLDITVDNADAQPGPVNSAAAPGSSAQSGRDRNVVDFCEGFMRTRSSIRHLIIRKNAYLTQPNATYVFEQLAKAIVRWHKLVSTSALVDLWCDASVAAGARPRWIVVHLSGGFDSMRCPRARASKTRQLVPACSALRSSKPCVLRSNLALFRRHVDWTLADARSV